MNHIYVFQFLGIIYAVVGLGILANPRYYKKMIDEYVRSTPVIFLNGFMVLSLGYIFLAASGTTPATTPIIVAILGWLALIKGLFILILPKAYIRMAKSLNMHHLMFEAIIALVLGGVFLYYGFVS